MFASAKAAIDDIVLMPDRRDALPISPLVHNVGTHSGAKRAQSAELTHEELAAMKAAVQVVFMADRLIEPPNECS